MVFNATFNSGGLFPFKYLNTSIYICRTPSPQVTEKAVRNDGFIFSLVSNVAYIIGQ